MSNFKRAPVAGGRDGPTTAGRSNNLIGALRATQMVESNSSAVLPAEIISTILDYLPIADQLSFARTSRRIQEMVYEDSRWVQLLKSMGVWSDAEARQRFDEARRAKRELMRIRAEDEHKKLGIGVSGPQAGIRKTSTTLFDASMEEEEQRKRPLDGFETLSLSSQPSRAVSSINHLSPEAILDVFSTVKSIRGSARQEFGKIYAALAPFYFDLALSRSHVDPIIFRVFREPEQQAQMLTNLQKFAKSDWAQGWRQREEKVNNMVGIFENAVLREFEQGYEAWDVDGKMRRYAHVLGLLNGSHAGIELFVQKHPLFSDTDALGHPMECINQAAADSIVLEPCRQFLENLSTKINEQSAIIDRVFPTNQDVYQVLLDKVAEDILMEYFTPLFDEARERSIITYLLAVSGTFEQSMLFGTRLKSTKGSGENFPEKAKNLITRVYEPHVDLYLQDELEHFTELANAGVAMWEKELSDQDASTESFFMANINRQADKKDFLSSFKKVVMMPVNVLPSLPMASPFSLGRAPVAPQITSLKASETSSPTSRTQSPDRSSLTLPPEAPTDELAAKTALMASRLAGIKSLFSIEVALDLTHAAKSSIARVSLFVRLGGQTGEEAREQCEALFVILVQILGTRHVKSGFDRAVEHLSKYNPREHSEHQKGVAPLVTFLELVNVGDLISQMIDVFYEQQLAAPKLADRNDFLSPALKSKKKFEQMLDERVAAGLNKGIDALMDEVEYVCATTQLTSDYNPPTTGNGQMATIDVGPTQTAQQVVELVAAHTNMLTGSGDKTMLDVFNQEVGLRLFAGVCKHLKRQRVSVDGAIKLISDMNIYFLYIRTLRNQDLLEYFTALRELSQIYLIDPAHAKELATIIADGDRFHGIFRAEEVYEFAERRADWYQVKKDVERAMYGIGCTLM